MSFTFNLDRMDYNTLDIPSLLDKLNNLRTLQGAAEADGNEVAQQSFRDAVDEIVSILSTRTGLAQDKTEGVS